MKRFAMLLVMFGFGVGACERHEFEGPNGTKQLHTSHNEEAADNDDEIEKVEDDAD